MSDNVVSIGSWREDKEPHAFGMVRCMSCEHEWSAVFKLPYDGGLECTECGLMRGVPVDNFAVRGEVFTCKCGGAHWQITRYGSMCISCGNQYSFSEMCD